MGKSFDEISEQLSFLSNRVSTTRIDEDGRIIRDGEKFDDATQETPTSIRRKELARILREQEKNGNSYDLKSQELRRKKIAQVLRGDDTAFDEFKQ